MSKIKFTQDYTVCDEQGAKYKAGKVYDMEPESCNHFVSRGAAEFYEPALKTAAKEKAELISFAKANLADAKKTKDKDLIASAEKELTDLDV